MDMCGTNTNHSSHKPNQPPHTTRTHLLEPQARDGPDLLDDLDLALLVERHQLQVERILGRRLLLLLSWVSQGRGLTLSPWSVGQSMAPCAHQSQHTHTPHDPIPTYTHVRTAAALPAPAAPTAPGAATATPRRSASVRPRRCCWFCWLVGWDGMFGGWIVDGWTLRRVLSNCQSFSTPSVVVVSLADACVPSTP